MSYFNVYIKLFVLILLGFIWGTGYSIARLAMTNGVPPLGYSFWQSLGPAIILSLITLSYQKNLKDKSKANKIACPSACPPACPPSGNWRPVIEIKYYFICGLLGIFIPNTCMYFAAPHLPAGILALVVNIVPIITYPLALCCGIESFNGQRMMGILMAFLAILLIIIPKSSLPSPHMIPWVLSTLITPLSFALCSIYISLYRPMQCNALFSTTGMLIFSSILLFPLVLYSQSFYVLHFPLNLPDQIILLEIVLSSIGYILFFYLINIAGPVYYSLVDTIVVLTGLFWGRLIFNEHLNQWTATSVCLIIIALLLVTKPQRSTAVESLKKTSEN